MEGYYSGENLQSILEPPLVMGHHSWSHVPCLAQRKEAWWMELMDIEEVAFWQLLS
jgi:hypothetical protein